jgi:glycosyltransferase involved in cell wall biosynthesis
LLAALSYGDAISNEALAIQGHLRAKGFASDIFAEHIHPRMARLARPLWEYERVSRAETVCLFHFSIGSAASRLIYRRPDRLACIYHNITPAEWFVEFHPHLAGLCHHGRRELRAFAARSELGLADSEFNRLELEEAGFRQTAVLPIVHDLAALARPPAIVSRRLWDDGRLNVLFVGRIIPNKKIDDLLRSFALFQRHLQPRSRLLLVGDYRGHERYFDRLQEMVRALGVQEVVFTGHVDDDDLRAAYAAGDVFLCLSEHEGYCVPLVEAMAAGVPVVAYAAGAVAETLRGGGVLLHDKSPELVAEVLQAVLTRPGMREAILEGQRQVMERLRATDFGALLLERLAPVLAGDASSGHASSEGATPDHHPPDTQ